MTVCVVAWAGHRVAETRTQSIFIFKRIVDLSSFIYPHAVSKPQDLKKAFFRKYCTNKTTIFEPLSWRNYKTGDKVNKISAHTPHTSMFKCVRHVFV